MANELQYSLLTVLHDRAASLLNDAATFTGSPGSAGLLLDLLRNPEISAPALDLGDLLDGFQLSDVFDDVGRLGGGPGGLIAGARQKFDGLIRGFVAGKGIEGVRQSLLALRPGNADMVRDRLLGSLTRQVGIGISFVTTVRNLANFPDIAEGILGGWKDYFFGERGFDTVDGITIVAPGHDVLGQIGQGLSLNVSKSLDSLKGLKGLLNERSAEQYVRDLIRITVEVAADARYTIGGRGVRGRYELMGVKVSENLPADVGEKNRDKAARWFKGAASMAESLVTSAVEEAVLGVSQFQTNPIIAATAATYAGTAARKATQHVFLSQVGV